MNQLWRSLLYALLSGLVSFLPTTVADNYVPVRYKFEPLPKYDELRKPRKGRSTYLKDPNVWVYSRDFAERFGMPERWIDNTLEGAEAVAFRIEGSRKEFCGYFGEENNCRNNFYCVFDVYLTDEDSKKLPWESHKLSEWRNDGSSRALLSPQTEEDYWYWYDEQEDRRYVRRGPTGLRSVVFVEGPPSKDSKKVYSGQEPMSVKSYRRDFFSGLDLVELKGCMAVSADQPVRIYFLDPQPSMEDPQYRRSDGSVDMAKLESAEKLLFSRMFSGRPPHKIKLPDAYMDKVRTHNKKYRHERSLATEAWKKFNRSSNE